MNPHGAGAAWRGVAEAYARSFAGQCAHTVAPLVDALGVTPRGAWLDVGTGAGAVAARAVRLGWQVVAADPAADMLRLARSAAPGAALVRTALPDLPFADGSFTAVSANFVLNHVPDTTAAVTELARVTGPGGRVGVTVWPSAPYPLRTLWDEVIAAAGVVAPGGEPAPGTGSPEDLAGLLASCGLWPEQAWLHTFTHVVDPGVWWSGATGGVARIGQVYLGHDERGRAALASAFHRCSARYLGTDGRLRLAGAAVVAVAVRE